MLTFAEYVLFAVAVIINPLVGMVTVSIVTYNTKLEELEKCFESLTSALIDTIYVIDNSSQKYIGDFCSAYGRVVYIPSVNSGFGAGHNKAIRMAFGRNSSYHLVLNSDVYFDAGAIESLCSYMDSNRDVGQVQPNIVYPDGRMQYTCRLLPTPADLIFRRFLPRKIAERNDVRYLLKFNDHKHEMNVPYHQGSFIFFRTDSLRTVGLFDERFFMYPEDIDITRRMHRHYRTMFLPSVTVVHAHRAESYKNSKMLWIHMTNMIKYFNKWGWFFDRERCEWNRKLLKELGYVD